MDEYPIRLGYACINSQLRDFEIFTSRKLTLKTAATAGLNYIEQLIEANLDDLYKILIYNEAHGIRFFRISSEIFPHLGNPKLKISNYSLDFVKKKLKIIGKYARDHHHRLTMHPPQFVQLASPHQKVIDQSFIDLANHARLLKMLGYTPQMGSVLIIHGGGVYDNKEETLKRWAENYLKLPPEVRAYIALENDENCYGIDDILPFCQKMNIPMCVDVFHNSVSKNKVPITYSLMKEIFSTWQAHGAIPKMHFSNQDPDNSKRGAHSKTILQFSTYLLSLPSILQMPLDIMLEVKDKELSVLKIYYQYFDIRTNSKGKIWYTLKNEYVKSANDITTNTLLT